MADQSEVTSALAKLDPSLATVLSSLCTSVSGITKRVDDIESSQERMRVSLQGQIDALSAAVGNTSANAAGGGAGASGIEHMFAKAESMEDMIKTHVESAFASTGMRGESDPFASISTAEGD